MRKNLAVFCLILISALLALPYILLSDIKYIEAVHLTEKNYSSVIEINGLIEAGKSVPICLSYPVYIKECFVSENDYVNKGQLLFTLDIEMMENAVKQSNITEYTEVYSSLDKNAFLTISEGIYASESGCVSQITAENGEIVLSDENLCVIETDDSLLLKITLNQEDYMQVSIGDTVQFSPLIMPSRRYYGTICDKTAVIRKETSLTGSKTVVDVFATINNADDKLVSGLQFSGKIIKTENKKIYTLPYEYINQDENGEYVHVFNNGNITKKYIETGIEENNYVEITTAFPENTLFLNNKYDGKGNILIKYDAE